MSDEKKIESNKWFLAFAFVVRSILSVVLMWGVYQETGVYTTFIVSVFLLRIELERLLQKQRKASQQQRDKLLSSIISILETGRFPNKSI